MAEKPSTESAIVREYGERQSLYGDFAGTLAVLLHQILRDGGVNIHSVTNRVKSLSSLARKVAQEGRPYDVLTGVTDLAGVRVTTYFQDDVDKAAGLIEREFQIDSANSVDKRKLIDPDRFGYVSLHFVVELGLNRAALPEYRRFAGLKAEMQLRSLLQHVWAEIEHDLGYKSARSVPAPIRRRFARLAGMLELADAEFVAIRNELTAYENELPERIEAEADAVALDRASLVAFQRQSESLKRIDAALASLVGAVIEPASDLFVDRNLGDLTYVGIRTIGELDAALRENEQGMIRFARLWFGKDRYGGLNQGIGIFYLTYVLLAKEGIRDRVLKWAEQKGMGPQSAEEIAEQVIQTARAAEV